MNLKNRSNLFFVFIFICLLLLNIPAAAQDTKPLSNSPVTHIDLGITSLTLKPGESYEFHITYEPSDPDITTLNWYVTDERVVQIDPMDAVVTALAEGEAQIFAQSMDGFSHAVCAVTVGTSAAKDITVMKSGSDILGLSARDMKKITARSLLDYISFLSDAWLDADSLENVTPRWFDVVAQQSDPGKKQNKANSPVPWVLKNPTPCRICMVSRWPVSSTRFLPISKIIRIWLVYTSSVRFGSTIRSRKSLTVTASKKQSGWRARWKD